MIRMEETIKFIDTQNSKLKKRKMASKLKKDKKVRIARTEIFMHAVGRIDQKAKFRN